jgi:3-dehydroquinate synthase
LRESHRLSGTVIATGGGSVLQPDLGRLVRNAVPVVLTAPAQELERRLETEQVRPLLSGSKGSRIHQLLDQRASAYAAAGPELDTGGKTVSEVAGLLAERYRAEAGQRTVRLGVRGPDGDYPVVVGRDSLTQLDQILSDQGPSASRVVVVCDRAVAAGLGRRLVDQLSEAGRDVADLEVGPGESAKRISVINELWDHFQELAIDRGDVIVAVGGGASLDAIGFAAATWLRGVPWITVPTTILAMVDASIGGKVAIDREGAKNSVGAFHHPRAVVCDATVLATLPPRSARDGLAEVIKGAVLASPLMLDALAEETTKGPPLPGNLDWMIEQAVRIKEAYVAADPQDRGVRQSLNLGHTYAHGLEAASDYSIPHGRAVALGLLAASTLGVRLGLSREDLTAQLRVVLGRLGLLEPLPAVDPERVRSALLLDKKRRGGVPAFIVPSIGGAVLVSGLEADFALEPLWEVLAQPDSPPYPRPAVPAGPFETSI